MTRRLFLHIGTMKSATSYIQELWELNRETLSTTGVLWPTAPHYHSFRELLGKSFAGADISGSWSMLAEEVRAHPGDVVVSNELLAGLRAVSVRRVAAALAEEEVHIVVTARDLARVMPSHWQTMVKNGESRPWHDVAREFCADGPPPREPSEASSPSLFERFWRAHDLAAIIKRWRKFVPIERMTVVTVPSAGADPETVAERFGSVVGVQLTGLAQPETRSNRSVGAHSVELMRLLNDRLTDLTRRERRDAIRDALVPKGLAPHADAEPSYGLTPDQLRWVTERAEQMIAAIAATNVRVVGDLADLRPSSLSLDDLVDPAVSTPSELLAAAEEGILGLVRELASICAERDAMASQLETLVPEPLRQRPG